MAEHDDTELIQPTEHLYREGKWFRSEGRGFWHLEAHSEYGVVWSKCGVRTVKSATESRDTIDEAAGDVACGRCVAKDDRSG